MENNAEDAEWPVRMPRNFQQQQKAPAASTTNFHSQGSSRARVYTPKEMMIKFLTKNGNDLEDLISYRKMEGPVHHVQIMFKNISYIGKSDISEDTALNAACEIALKAEKCLTPEEAKLVSWFFPNAHADKKSTRECFVTQLPIFPAPQPFGGTRHGHMQQMVAGPAGCQPFPRPPHSSGAYQPRGPLGMQPNVEAGGMVGNNHNPPLCTSSFFCIRPRLPGPMPVPGTGQMCRMPQKNAAENHGSQGGAVQNKTDPPFLYLGFGAVRPRFFKSGPEQINGTPQNAAKKGQGDEDNQEGSTEPKCGEEKHLVKDETEKEEKASAEIQIINESEVTDEAHNGISSLADDVAHTQNQSEANEAAPPIASVMKLEKSGLNGDRAESSAISENSYRVDSIHAEITSKEETDEANSDTSFADDVARTKRQSEENEANPFAASTKQLEKSGMKGGHSDSFVVPEGCDGLSYAAGIIPKVADWSHVMQEVVTKWEMEVVVNKRDHVQSVKKQLIELAIEMNRLCSSDVDSTHGHHQKSLGAVGTRSLKNGSIGNKCDSRGSGTTFNTTEGEGRDKTLLQATGKGNSMKAAKTDAAREMLEMITKEFPQAMTQMKLQPKSPGHTEVSVLNEFCQKNQLKTAAYRTKPAADPSNHTRTIFVSCCSVSFVRN